VCHDVQVRESRAQRDSSEDWQSPGSVGRHPNCYVLHLENNFSYLCELLSGSIYYRESIIGYAIDHVFRWQVYEVSNTQFPCSRITQLDGL
jgi:hypothetical protein